MRESGAGSHACEDLTKTILAAEEMLGGYVIRARCCR